jgi:hypothetical protein
MMETGDKGRKGPAGFIIESDNVSLEVIMKCLLQTHPSLTEREAETQHRRGTQRTVPAYDTEHSHHQSC